MVIFLLLGILFFPRIIADEIKIDENGSVHWIRNWKEVDKNNTLAFFNDNGKTYYVNKGRIKELVAVNTEMKYKIDSPLNTTIGKLEKETKIEGCQHRGCNIILRFGDGTVFYQERIYKSIDKIVIDLGQSRLNDNYHFEKKGNK